jgi:hypothetical protein
MLRGLGTIWNVRVRRACGRSLSEAVTSLLGSTANRHSIEREINHVRFRPPPFQIRTPTLLYLRSLPRTEFIFRRLAESVLVTRLLPEDGLPRPKKESHARFSARPALRASPGTQEPAIHDDRRRYAGPWNRREHRDLLGGSRSPACASAVSRRGSPRDDMGQ